MNLNSFISSILCESYNTGLVADRLFFYTISLKRLFQIFSILMNVVFIKIGFPTPKPPVCLEALGMQNGEIRDSAITASTEYNAYYKAMNGRLHFLRRGERYGAWVAKKSDAFQYLQVDFGDLTKVTRVAI